MITDENIYKLFLPLGSKVFLFGMLFAFLGVTILMFLLPYIVSGPDTPPAFIGFFWLLIVGWNLFLILRIPHEIVLHNDGTVEFNAVIRKVQMNAGEIASMNPANGTFGFMIIKGKKNLRLLAQFDNFHDFISKLKQHNPSIIIRGY
jgi:hypothetical protein